MQAFGVDGTLATVFMTMNVSALALTSLDAVARIARTSFSEFFAQTNDALAIESKAGYMKVLGNPWFATVVTLLPGLALAFGGYANIWPLFGASNQLLAALGLLAVAAWLGKVGKNNKMLIFPMAFMLIVTVISLLQTIYANVTNAVDMWSWIRAIIGSLLVLLSLVLAKEGCQTLFKKKA